ncbi:MAG TPA: hypothetical protein PK683_01355 [Leptospiraceae bacterium]|nr:hypothetical protein [Leptospiraceae bacterium]
MQIARMLKLLILFVFIISFQRCTKKKSSRCDAKTGVLGGLFLYLNSCERGPSSQTDQLKKPFASTSIWNRLIPADAVYSDVSDAVSGDSAAFPAAVGPDIVAICYTDPAAPAVKVEKNIGWDYPGRGMSSGQVQYTRQLSASSCAGLSMVKNGNGLFAIVDMKTGSADQGVGGWRCNGGSILHLLPDSTKAHISNVITGDGLQGYGRGSSLPSLGGVILQGEISSGINHAVAVTLPQTRFSKTKNYVWPASSADSIASNPDYGYQGPNTSYTMGTLLAIPKNTDISSLGLSTPQARQLASAAQNYGWYIADASGYAKGKIPSVQFAMEAWAAKNDLGFTVDYSTEKNSIDKSKLDDSLFTADIQKILKNLKAVTSNTQ